MIQNATSVLYTLSVDELLSTWSPAFRAVIDRHAARPTARSRQLPVCMTLTYHVEEGRPESETVLVCRHSAPSRYSPF